MKALITIDENIDEIYNALLPEIGKQNRSQIKVKKDKALTFEITSKDFTAFRASMNSVMQMLTVFFKMKGIQ